MKILSRLCVFILAVPTVVLAFAAVLVPALGGPDLLFEVTEVGPWYLEEDRRTEDLEQRDRDLRRCLEVKREVTSQLVAGRLTLLEAAERFRAARAECGDLEWLAGDDDDEAICRNVINWARAHSRDDPRSGKVIADLESQLRRHLDKRRKSAP